MEHILFGFCRVINSENDKWISVGIFSTCILVGHCIPRRLCLRSFDFCIKYHQCHMMANAIRTEERKPNTAWRMSTVYLMSFWYSLLRNVEIPFTCCFTFGGFWIWFKPHNNFCMFKWRKCNIFWILLVIALDCSVPLQQNSIRFGFWWAKFLLFGKKMAMNAFNKRIKTRKKCTKATTRHFIAFTM